MLNTRRGDQAQRPKKYLDWEAYVQGNLEVEQEVDGHRQQVK